VILLPMLLAAQVLAPPAQFLFRQSDGALAAPPAKLPAATVVAPTPKYRLDASDTGTITTAGSTVSSWTSTGSNTQSFTQGTAGQRPVSDGVGQVDFDGTDDFVSLGSQASTANSHWFAVVTIDAVDTNGTGAACNSNDGVAGWPTGYGGLKLRESAGVTYLVGHNFDGAGDCAEVVVSKATKILIEMKVDGSDVSVATNGGAFTSTPSGNTTVAGDSVMIGSGNAGGARFDGKVHEVWIYDNDLATADRNVVVTTLRNQWGFP